MQRRTRLGIIGVLAMLAVAQGVGPGAPATFASVSTHRYTYVDLGLPTGASSAYATGVNASGQAVGIALISQSQHAVLWTEQSAKGKSGTQTTATDLGTLPGGTNSYAAGINDAGTVVGTSDNSRINSGGGTDSSGFVWTPIARNGTTGTMTDIGTFGGQFSEADGINNAGQFVGDSQDATAIDGFGFNQSFLYPAPSNCPSTVTAIDTTLTSAFCNLTSTLPPQSNSSARAINNEVNNDPTTSEVAGGMNTATGFFAFLYSAGGLIDLGTLGGDISQALGINDYGQVVGFADTSGDAAPHAFLWHPTVNRGTTGTMHDLGVLPGMAGSYATGINDGGEVVGWSFPSDPSVDAGHAFIWRPTMKNHHEGSMTDLNTEVRLPSGVTLEYAAATNASGWIVGGARVGTDTSGNPIIHPFLLKPA